MDDHPESRITVINLRYGSGARRSGGRQAMARTACMVHLSARKKAARG